ncbi:MBL fold metallo-hydrolase [Gloeobacter violaceus]|nr:MBL fold metallo-hydrolase [Gloeobacter violaceus]
MGKRWVAFGLGLAGSLAAVAAVAQQVNSTASEQSLRRARAVLDAGIEALGGPQVLEKSRRITLKEVGHSLNAYQSANPEPPYSKTAYEEVTVIDYKDGRLFNEQKSAFPGIVVWNRTIIDGQNGYNLDMRAKTAVAIADPSIAANRAIVRKLPHLLLREARNRVDTLRWVGEDDFGGKKQQVITYARDDGRQLALYFDAQTRLLTKSDFLYTDPAVGDSRSEFVYPGYREVEGVKVPTGRSFYNAGEPIQTTEYTQVQFGQAVSDAQVAIPANFNKAPAPTPDGEKLTQLGDGVYLLENAALNYNTLFVAFEEYVLVVDAPEPLPYSAHTSRVIERIKKTVPGKPIQYLVLTHHHADHTGGVRTYIAEGTTVVTTPGNRGAIEKLMAGRYTIAPDEFARKPQPLKLETIEGKKRVFRDGKRIVEFYDIGPNPHAQEMVVAWLPKEKILFQADLINVNAGGTVPPAQEATISLAQRLAQLGITPERIACVHGRTITAQELRASLVQARDDG